MTSKISTHSQVQHSAPTKPKAKASKNSTEKKGVGARDVVALGGAAAAGTVGFVYGGVEGLVKGTIKNFPEQIGSGARTGKKVLGTVGKVAGGVTATAMTSLYTLASPVAAVLGGPVGLAVGTGIGAIKNTGVALTRAGEFGSAGLQTGGDAFGVAGKIVGGAAGWIVGLLKGGGEAVLKGAMKEGLEMGKLGAKGGWEMVKSVPNVAKQTYKSEIKGGARIFGAGGAAIGGTFGTLTASGTTVVDGVAGSVKRGGQWANTVGGYILGPVDSGLSESSASRPVSGDHHQG